jgi:hypothetical protein
MGDDMTTGREGWTMRSAPAGTRSGRSAGRPPLPLLLLALALGAAAGALPASAQATTGPATAPSRARAVSAAALESEHGLRVTRVAVTGNGGLVDLRFTVLDPLKARPLLQGGGHDLRLVVEKGGVALEAPHHGAMRNVRLARDAACFVLFPNARGAVQPGGRVAVEFGGVSVEAVAAR